MAEQLQEKRFALKLQPKLSIVGSSETTAPRENETEVGSSDESTSRIFRLIHLLSRPIIRLKDALPMVITIRQAVGDQGGGIRMIFRRENRGESFQRQISDLRQQPSDAPAEEAEQISESEEMPDTSRFSTQQDESATEGISFPATRTESPTTAEPAPAEAAEAVPEAPPAARSAQRYANTTRWQAPSSDATTSVIAANSHWNGTLMSEGSLRVHGKADGELHSTTDLFVAEGAEVDAELHADSVVVAGLVRGRIEARSRLEVLPEGEVTGDVRAPKLVVHEGATISGQLKMESGDSQPTYSRESKATES